LLKYAKVFHKNSTGAQRKMKPLKNKLLSLLRKAIKDKIKERTKPKETVS
jgi:hypothetical protein